MIIGELSDISYQRPYSRDSNNNKMAKSFPSVEKNRFEIFGFLS